VTSFDDSPAAPAAISSRSQDARITMSTVNTTLPKKSTKAKATAAKKPKKAAPQKPGAKKRAGPSESGPEISIVIPVYNEEAILERALRGLITSVRTLERSFEVVLATNGCKDMTIPIAKDLMLEFPELTVLECPTPNYGAALKLGIETARGSIILCDEIDLCDVDFYRRALRRLDHDECEMVVGSKSMRGARDRRPMTRRMATKVINRLLWAATGFTGTDTHGLKAFLRKPLMPVMEACVVDKDMFASEFVIRAGRAGLRVQEIPIELEEQRSPAIHLFKRVPRVLKDVARLGWAIRFAPPKR
jgi:hypothetical protein